MLYAICYDVTSTRRRAKLAKVLKGYGRRVQRSVFECRLGEQDFGKLKERLARLGLAETDLLRYYPLCRACTQRIEFRGGAPPAPEAEDVIV